MKIKFANNTEIEAKNIKYNKSNKTKSIIFEKRIRVKTKAGTIAFNEIELDTDNKLKRGILGDYLTLKSEYNTEIVCDPLDTIETYGTIEINRILFDGVKTIKTKYGPIDVVSPIRLYPIYTPKEIHLYKPITIKTDFGNIKLSGKVILNFNGTIHYYKSDNQFIVEINNKKYSVYSIMANYSHDSIQLELATSDIFDTPIGKLRLKYVTLDKNKVILGELYEPQTINTEYGELTIRGDISFHANNTINTLELAKPTTIKTQIGQIKIRDNVYFDTDNKIQTCFLEDVITLETKAGKISISNGSYASVEFYNSGKLRKCYLANRALLETPFGNIMCKDRVGFDEEGNIIMCNLDDAMDIKTNQGYIPIFGQVKFRKNTTDVIIKKAISFSVNLPKALQDSKDITNTITTKTIKYEAYSIVYIDKKGNIIYSDDVW